MAPATQQKVGPVQPGPPHRNSDAIDMYPFLAKIGCMAERDAKAHAQGRLRPRIGLEPGSVARYEDSYGGVWTLHVKGNEARLIGPGLPGLSGPAGLHNRGLDSLTRFGWTVADLAEVAA